MVEQVHAYLHLIARRELVQIAALNISATIKRIFVHLLITPTKQCKA